MKERVDAKMLREPASAAATANGPGSQDMNLGGGPMAVGHVGAPPKMETDIKTEVKEEDSASGKKSTSSDSRPPSRKLNNGDSDSSMGVKTEDNNNKRIKLEKKHDSVKCENGKPGSVEKSSPQMPTTPQLPSSGGNTPSTIMPNACHGGMITSTEPPFMQQQSQIFVFSTTLANQATESIRAGQCKNIIQYHMEHPNTKAFLQKHPLKSSNDPRMCGPQAMGGPGMKGRCPMGGMMNMQSPNPNWRPGTPMEDPSMMGPGGGPMMPGGNYPPNSMGPRMMGGGGWPGGPHPHGGPPMMGPGVPYPPGSMMDMDNPDMMGYGTGPMNISSSQVPDENLTSEQRQHRSKGLAQLTKIHQMLMGGNGSSQDGRAMMGPDGRPAHPGMYPGGHRMTSQQQQAMMYHQGGPGMMSPHGMMSPQQQHQHMMAQQGMSPYGPRCPGPVPPGMNGKDQFHAQREWMQIQQDFMMEKQHRMQHMRGGPPHMEQCPPPSYYSSISQKHGGMPGPTSPPMNGMPMPSMPPQGHMAPGMEHEAMGMYGPPHMGMDPMAPGMQGYPPHGMPPQGPMDPGFDPTMPGAMAPGISPGAPRHAGPMGPHSHHHPHMMGPGLATSPSQVTLHRAGNPEQFNPETMGGVIPPVIPASSTGGNNNSSSNKPPPSYAQAQKRKRPGDDLDDYSKGNLQHTPSPTKIHYHLNQFEGQELTITKQLNAAFVAGSGGDESLCPDNSVPPPGGHFNNNSHTNSPALHGPNKGGPLSNSSQVNSHMSSPPVVPPTSSAGGPSPMGPHTPHSTGANMRLSHFDPALSNGVSSAPQTPNPSNPKGSSTSSSSSSLSSASSSSNSNPSITSPAGSAMSNITSASLANLAKGVENLSNQMQQNMMQGGPFHSIQMQGQMAAAGANNGAMPNPANPAMPANNNNGNNSNMNNTNNNNSSNAAPSVSNAVAVTSQPTTCPPVSVSPNINSTPSLQTSTSTVTPPSVNNTYIATNMSISQVNIPNHPGLNSYVNMQMQSMSSESSSTAGHPQGPPGSVPGSQPHPLPPGGPAMNQAMLAGGNGPRGPGPMSHQHHHHMSQSQSMMSSCPMGGGPPGMMQGPMAPNPGQMMNHPAGGPHPSHMGPAPSMTPPAISKGGPPQFASPPLSHSQMPGSAGNGPPSQAPPGVSPSPQFHPSAVPPNSNSSVQIQQKGHNTIQYLPANPPSSNAMPNNNKTRPSEIDYSGMPRFPSPHPIMDVKSPASSTLQYFPNNSPGGGPRPPMSSAMSAMGPEFANQANIAMQQSAVMMRSPSLSDMQVMSGGGPGSVGPVPGGPGSQHGMPPNSMGPMDNRVHSAGPICGPNHMMGGPDPMMGMGHQGPPMRPGHSPGMMRHMPPVMGSGSLECVSPIPGMGGYMNNGPSIEQAQAQAQAHAAMMMQGNTPIPESPHPPPTSSSANPNMMSQGSNPTSSMSGTSPHGGPSMVSQPHGGSMSVPSPHGAPGPSPHAQMVPGPSPHAQMVPGPSPHRPMPPGPSPHGQPMPPGPSPHGQPMVPGPSPHGPMAPGPSPHGPMGPGPSPHPHMPQGHSPHGAPMGPGPSPHGGPMAPGHSPHGHMGGMSPHHVSMAAGMPPHGHMGHMSGPPTAGMHGPPCPSMGPGGNMSRHPSMGGPMAMGGPGGMGGPMGPGGSGQFPPGNMQYPQYQPDFYHPSSRGPPHQMMGGPPSGMMGGPPGQPYGMLPSMPGPS